MKSHYFFVLVFVNLLAIETYGQSKVSGLSPLIEPAPVTFSFNTPGWYVLGAALLMVFIILTYRWVKKYKANAYRRIALHKLAEIEGGMGRADPSNTKIGDAFILLKSVAITAYGRLIVGPLHGKEWLGFLDDKGNGVSFTAQEEVINRALFLDQPLNKEEQSQLLTLTKEWIKYHA